MKFTDGYWRVKENHNIFNATEIRDVQLLEDRILVYAACRKVMSAGQTFNEPLITVEYSSPMENVIKVRAWHHKGRQERGPVFEIEPSAPLLQISRMEERSEFKSGSLRAVIPNKGDWDVQFYFGDKYLTGTGYKSTAYITNDKKEPYMREQLHLDVGTMVYGLGERFTPFCKNGQTVDMWNDDGGTCSEVAYKNVPFFITNKGYGVLVNHPEKVSFEVATEVVSRVQFSVPGEYVEYYLFGGDSMAEVLQLYTMLLGKPALPPAWSFGLWISTSAQPEQSEKILRANVEEMRKRDLPFSVYYLCCFWMKEYQFCDFQWNREAYPAPQKMIDDFKAQGIHICLWTNPFISQKSSLFDIGKEKGYFLKTRDGHVWQWDRWQNGMAVVDFTNPEAVKWYQGHIKSLLDMGIDSVKMDFGERIPEDVVYYDGSDPQKMHNYYAYLYQKAVFEVIDQEKGKNNAMSFSRAGTAGCQKFPIHWGGDNSSTYDSMAETLRGGLSLSLSGFGFWTHDTGGFEQYPTPDLYKRWTAFGLLSCHSRIHGNTSLRLPWLFGEDCVDVMRYFTRLKYSLMPYLFANACVTARTGLPFMRPMVLAFEEDLNCRTLDQQYMLGDSLLVAPIFNERGSVTYYLPKGRWTNFLSGESVEGGAWQTETHDYMSLPLMVRPNSMIPVGHGGDKPDYDYTDNPTLQVFQLEDNAEAACTVYGLDGEAAYTVSAKRNGKQIAVTCSSEQARWTLLMRGIHAVSVPDGVQVLDLETGTQIIPKPGSWSFCFLLEE